MATFGEWLTSQLEAGGLRWGDLAEATGLSVSAVTAWGRDESRPRPRNVPAIARLLRLPQSEVYVALGTPQPYRRGTDNVIDTVADILQEMPEYMRLIVLRQTQVLQELGQSEAPRTSGPVKE